MQRGAQACRPAAQHRPPRRPASRAQSPPRSMDPGRPGSEPNASVQPSHQRSWPPEPRAPRRTDSPQHPRGNHARRRRPGARLAPPQYARMCERSDLLGTHARPGVPRPSRSRASPRAQRGRRRAGGLVAHGTVERNGVRGALWPVPAGSWSKWLSPVPARLEPSRLERRAWDRAGDLRLSSGEREDRGVPRAKTRFEFWACFRLSLLRGTWRVMVTAVRWNSG